MTSFFNAKTYEEWLSDFLIDIVIHTTYEPQYFKLRYIDACNMNNKICPTYNTFQLYENYIYYWQIEITMYVLLFTCVVSVVIFSLYRYSKIAFGLMACAALYYLN